MPHQAATLQPDGRKIQRLRKHKNLTQAKLAKRAGISVKTEARIEGGGRTSPFFLGCIATALDTQIEEITLPDPAVVAPNTHLAEPALTQAEGLDQAKELRRRLCDLADRDFRKRVNSANFGQYIPLELQERLVPPAHSNAQPSNRAVPPLGFRTRWNTVDAHTLLFSRQPAFLTSVGGSGKTVFLRHLQKEACTHPDLIPFYLKASELDALESLSWRHVRSLLCRTLGPLLPETSIAAALDAAFSSDRLLLLVDSVGGSLAPRRRYDEFVAQLIDVMNGGRVIFAGRSSVAQWIDGNPLVRLIRLQPLDVAARKKFFEGDYDRAFDSCCRAPNLLGLPAFAYMARRRLRSERSSHIRSRWDLVSHFLRQFLREHSSYLGHTLPELTIEDLELALGWISYKALSSSTSELGSVPLILLEDLDRELRVPLDALIATGVPDLFEVNRHPATPCLTFLHPMLQEAFAAKWVVQGRSINTVISECWDPKWRDVILLVAGDEYRDIVDSLYPDAPCNDPIHHRLLLAAECAGQRIISSALETRLIHGLQPLWRIEAFADDALRALVCINSHDAHETAWDLCTAHSRLGESSTTLGSRLRPDDLRPLYTPERLEWLLQQLETANLSPLGDLLLAAWTDLVMPERAVAILHSYLADGSVRCDAAFSHLIKTLDADGLQQVILAMFPETDMIRSARLDSLVRGFSQNMYLESSHIDLLLNAAGRFTNYVAVASVLESVSPRLTERHLLRLSDEWWTPKGAMRRVLVEVAPAVCSRLPDTCIDDLVELNAGKEFGGAAASVLRPCRHRVAGDRLKRLLSCIRQGQLRPDAIDRVMAATTSSPKWAAKRILAGLTHDDCLVRTAAMKSCGRLSHMCTKGHWQACESNLRTATEAGRDRERRAAITAVSCSGQLLSSETVWYILRTLKDEDFAWEAFDEEETVLHACQRLSHVLGDEQIKYVVRRICSLRDGGLAAGLCSLLTPEQLSAEDLLQLCRHLHVMSRGVLSERLLLLLRKAHDTGRLEGLGEMSE